jgi:hypothetical protein
MEYKIAQCVKGLLNEGESRKVVAKDVELSAWSSKMDVTMNL